MPQDYTQAAKWYRKAADQGNADAQPNLGLMYEKGQGVPQDYAQAVSWYRKAADQGTPWRSPTSADVRVRPRACRRTTRRPPCGTAKPPSRGTPSRRTPSACCALIILKQYVQLFSQTQ